MQVQIELPTDFLNDIDHIKKELVNLKKNILNGLNKGSMKRQQDFIGLKY